MTTETALLPGGWLGQRLPGLSQHWAVLKAAWAQENERSKTRRQIDNTAFLPAALEVMETPASPYGRGLIWFIVSMVIVALLWAVIGHVDVVAVASGKTLPAARVKVIQPTELGVVRSIHVREGQHVEAGELLVELDPTVATADTSQSARTLLAAEIDAARSRALLSAFQGGPPRFEAPSGTPPEIAQVQRTLITASLSEYEAQRAALVQQRLSAAAERSASLKEIAKHDETLPLLKRRLDAERGLAAKGLTPQLDLVDAETRYVQGQKDAGIARDNARRAAATIGSIDQQLAQLRQEKLRETLAALSDAENRAEVARQDLVKSRERSSLQRISAPVAGTVHQLQVHTIGGVVQPAEPILTIVPDEGGLIVLAQVLNKDVGFVHPGQEVAVKIEAFPFVDYGTVTGTLEAISRDAVQDEKMGLVYTARVRLHESQIKANGRSVSLTPGMAVQAEIKTGKRRIISYLLSPIAKTAAEAGRER